MSDYGIWPIFGPVGLLISCSLLLLGFAVVFFFMYLLLACLVDVFRKTDDEFPNRILWIVLLLASIPFGLVWLIAPLYYFLFRPRLDLWNR